MKKFDLKEKSSVFYIGKGIIILAIVVTSSVSFLLGFFVGKGVAPHSAEKAPLVAPLAAPVQKNTVSEAKESAPPQTQQMPATQPPDVQMPPEKPVQQKTEEARGSVEMKKTLPPQGSKQNNEIKQDKEKAVKNHESAKPQEVEKTVKKLKYTVQIGAFKNESEADSLKSKFIKKGYKAFTIAARTKKNDKLYKVMVGEFVSRQEADLLSVKLKRAEGLRAFVTLKPDKEGIR